MAGANTHAVELGSAVVVKRFRSRDQDRPGREWRALTLLAEYAPGLAPEPLRADLDADPPAIEMSRLDGVPLTAPVTAEQTAARVALGSWSGVRHRVRRRLPRWNGRRSR